jgi:branched-chain amino acid transport system ATP-binding protein
MFLHAKNMVGGYGETTILNNCSINVKQGEIAVIVGPNGAGKSTAMKAIFGMLDLRQGNVFFDGEDITYLSPQDRVKKGMGFVPQTNNVFTSMTVLENLEIGGFTNLDKIKSNIKEIFNLFPILEEKQKQIVGELSGGQRQQVAVGRALMTNPKLLMLDEPTAGVSPIVVKELFEKIINIAKAGIAILMVEQNAKQALEISDNCFVLVQGENKFTRSMFGTARAIINNMVVGVSQGFKKELEIQGVGYRAEVGGKVLKLQLGYSHPIEFNIPEGINIKVNQNIISVEGYNKELVGSVAAKIREFRKPDPYKGKGIRYVGERIIRKAGKTGK